MYITNSQEQAFDLLCYSAKLLAYEVEEAGGEWGAWVYEDFEVATYDNGENGTRYYTLNIHMTSKDVMEIRNRVAQRMRDENECGHWTDCCGCWFFSGLSLIRERGSYDNHWIVRESWGRNI